MRSWRLSGPSQTCPQALELPTLIGLSRSLPTAAPGRIQDAPGSDPSCHRRAAAAGCFEGEYEVLVEVQDKHAAEGIKALMPCHPPTHPPTHPHHPCATPPLHLHAHTASPPPRCSGGGALQCAWCVHAHVRTPMHAHGHTRTGQHRAPRHQSRIDRRGHGLACRVRSRSH
jgi:hypothetical protein